MSVLSIMLALLAAPQDPNEWKERLKEPKLDILEAMRLGVRQAGGEGIVYHAELEKGKDGMVYSIDLIVGDKAMNVVVSAKDGSVVKTVDETSSLGEILPKLTVDLYKAVEMAQAIQAGPVIDAQLRVKDGIPQIRVKSFTGEAVENVVVDATTGKLIGDYTKVEKLRVDKERLGPTGRNPYFILEPRYRLELEGKAGEQDVRLEITVTDDTRKIDGVETRMVEIRKTVAGELTELSKNYFAICERSNSVYYFGREVELYKDREVVGNEGTWISGENDARFGLIMPGTPLQDAKYNHQTAPRVAMNRAHIVHLSAAVQTPLDTFKECLKIQVTTSLQQGVETTIYAPDVGLVQVGALKLVKRSER
ncbi:MAG TPA: hypothetical protein VI643_06720 [Planctomycetota bacterium]|nr:hypothetical protein [Planctomycetota bacterium]